MFHPFNAGVCYFLVAEKMPKICESKSDLSLSWLFFPVPVFCLIIIAIALLIPSVIESHL